MKLPAQWQVVSKMFVVLLIIFTAAACTNTGQPADPDVTATAPPPNCTCDLFSFPFDGPVPGDANLLNQSTADCFAWYEFITLNAPADSTDSSFGTPGNVNPVRWEAFMDASLLFQADAATPPAWGTQPSAPSGCEKQARAFGKRLKTLTHASKFAVDFDVPGSEDQASSGPNWLGAQNGTNLWYNVNLSEDEYNYIVSHRFYNAQAQDSFCTVQDSMINLPAGITYRGQTTQLGAMELKSAWMEVDNPADAKWKRYKLSDAILLDLSTGACRIGKVALVGLHILHKTSSQNSWVWATFDHVDNVPDSSSGGSGPYNFYNPACTPQTVTVPGACMDTATQSPQQVTFPCTPNTSPRYYLCQGGPGPRPIQVTRQYPLSDSIVAVNTRMQRQIKAAYPNSVFQYYQLVNVIWSTAPISTGSHGTTVPVNMGNGMQPPLSQPVSNPVLETYVQSTTCFSCHQYATIAPTPTDLKPKFQSDFSFLFSTASYPGADDGE